jgi:hypothetical protein
MFTVLFRRGATEQESGRFLKKAAPKFLFGWALRR